MATSGSPETSSGEHDAGANAPSMVHQATAAAAGGAGQVAEKCALLLSGPRGGGEPQRRARQTSSSPVVILGRATQCDYHAGSRTQTNPVAGVAASTWGSPSRRALASAPPRLPAHRAVHPASCTAGRDLGLRIRPPDIQIRVQLAPDGRRLAAALAVQDELDTISDADECHVISDRAAVGYRATARAPGRTWSGLPWNMPEVRRRRPLPCPSPRPWSPLRRGKTPCGTGCTVVVPAACHTGCRRLTALV